MTFTVESTKFININAEGSSKQNLIENIDIEMDQIGNTAIGAKQKEMLIV